MLIYKFDKFYFSIHYRNRVIYYNSISAATSLKRFDEILVLISILILISVAPPLVAHHKHPVLEMHWTVNLI